MSKTSFVNVLSGFNLQGIKTNFDKIALALQNQVLYRNNPPGEPNQMESDLDMNTHNVMNAGVVDTAVLRVGGVIAVPTELVTVGDDLNVVNLTADTGVFDVSLDIPTADPGDNDTSAANTAFVTAAVAVETARAIAAESGKISANDAALTGNSTSATVPALHDSTTKIANTQFVINEVNAAVMSGLPVLTNVQASISTSIFSVPSSTSVIPFDTVQVDLLGEYNSTTHTFTASATGVYLFSGVISLFFSGSKFTFRGPQNHILVSNVNGNNISQSYALVVNLTAGQTWQPTSITTDGSAIFGDSAGTKNSYISIKRLV